MRGLCHKRPAQAISKGWSRLLLIKLRELEDCPKQTGFQRLIAVNGNRDDRAFAGLAIDVVAALGTLELPAILFQQAANLFAAIGFQTAISRT